MFEFEMIGTFEDLNQLEIRLLQFLDFENIHEAEYSDIAKKYNVETLDNSHEMMLYKDFWQCCIIEKFSKFNKSFLEYETK